MSQKKSTTKFEEPLKLETTILKIDVKTIGDLKTKDYDLIPFHPNMADIKDLSNNNYIFFPTFAKITMNDLKRAQIGTNYLKIFTSLDKYLKLVEYIASDERETDNTLIVDQSQAKQYAVSFLEDITGDVVEDFVTVQKDENTEEGLTDDEIITNNIGLIKGIFFPKGGRFYVLGHEYVIGKSKYIPPFISSSDLNQKLREKKHIVPLNYTITVDLELLDATNNPNSGDFGRLSCKAKKINIKNDMVDIFGTEFKFLKEEKKAILPSLLKASPEITERGYGKLQKEWEERNKYVKPPETEAERLALEKSWTPLQRKMAQLDKVQQEFNKIPQLWVKDRTDLDKKYTDFFTTIEKYKKEIADIKDVNADDKDSSFVKDLIQRVVDKMALATKNLLVDVNKVHAFTLDISEMKNTNFVDLTLNMPELNLLLQEKQGEYKKSNYSGADTDRLKDLALQMVLLKKLDDIIAKVKKNQDISEPEKDKDIAAFKELEKEIINTKYVDPFLDDLKIKQKDVNYLKEQEKKLDDEIKKNPEDRQNIYKKDELAKIQAKLFKKQVDLRKLEATFGKNGESLVKDVWEKSLAKMDNFKSTVKNEKKLEETRIEYDTVNKELKDKFKEIETAKKLFLIVSSFAGEDKELTKDEKEKFDKQDKPVENYEDLKKNIEAMEEEYLEIAKKLGVEKKIQAKMTLLNYDAERLKTIKKAKEDERKKKDDELENKYKSKQKILDLYISSTGVSIKPIPPEEQKRIDELTTEQIPLRFDSNRLKITVDRINKKKMLYEKLIDDLKKTKTEEVYKTRLDNFEKKLEALKEYSEGIEDVLPKKTYTDDEKTKILEYIKKEEIDKLKDNDKDYDKKKENIEKKTIVDPEYSERIVNKLTDSEKQKYEKTYIDRIADIDKAPTSGGRRRHNTRRHKRTKPKKTIRKNTKKNKKKRTYKRLKMAKKTIRKR
jgi:hypothetical protein